MKTGSDILRTSTAVLEGTWAVTVTPYNCQTGEEFPQVAFVSYFTFVPGGIVLETTSHGTFQPGQRSPGHGYWEWTGYTSYHSVMQAFVLYSSVDPQPPARAYQRRTLRFDPRGRPGYVRDTAVSLHAAAVAVLCKT